MNQRLESGPRINTPFLESLEGSHKIDDEKENLYELVTHKAVEKNDAASLLTSLSSIDGQRLHATQADAQCLRKRNMQSALHTASLPLRTWRPVKANKREILSSSFSIAESFERRQSIKGVPGSLNVININLLPALSILGVAFTPVLVELEIAVSVPFLSIRVCLVDLGTFGELSICF